MAGSSASPGTDQSEDFVRRAFGAGQIEFRISRLRLAAEHQQALDGARPLL
jgi:hypothetical protein